MDHLFLPLLRLTLCFVFVLYFDFCILSFFLDLILPEMC